MELDEIKNLWIENGLLKEKQKVSNYRIKEMLKNKGVSALDKLINTAKIYMIITIPLGLFLCLLSYKFFEAGGYYVIWPILFLLLSVFLEFKQLFLYRLLKEIDFSTMSVKEVSEKIYKYQSIIQKGRLFGTIFGIVYLGIWYYLYYQLLFGSETNWFFIIFMISMCVVAGFLIQFLYNKLYFKNINQIKESLKELKDFEES